MTVELSVRLGTAVCLLLTAALIAKLSLTDRGRARRRATFVRATLSPSPLAAAADVDRFLDWRLRRGTAALAALGVVVLLPLSLGAFTAAVILAVVLVDSVSLVDVWRRAEPSQGSRTARVADFASPPTRTLGAAVAATSLAVCVARGVWPADYEVSDALCWATCLVIIARTASGELVVRRLVASVSEPATDAEIYTRDALVAQQVKEVLTLPVVNLMVLNLFAFWTIGPSAGVPNRIVMGFSAVVLVLLMVEVVASGFSNWNLRFRKKRWGAPQPVT